ncbi:hypothetical protein MAH4_29080 [Sessilibacter sp. MAH4]
MFIPQDISETFLNVSEKTESLQQQIDDLQARVAFQEDSLTALDEVIAKQDRMIIELNKKLDMLVGRVKDLRDQLQQGGDPLEERPPHY